MPSALVVKNGVNSCCFTCSGMPGPTSVTDCGPGIPEPVAQQLFTPFYTTKAEGMGLGLSLCRTVIEQHGGALDFGSLPDTEGKAAGEGAGAMTEFRFTLPADTTDRRSPPPASSLPQGSDVAPTIP